MRERLSSNGDVILQQRFRQGAIIAPALSVKRSLSARGLCCLHGASVSVPLFLLLFGAPPWWTLGLGGMVVSLVYVYIGYAESQRQEFWLSPMSFFFFWYVVGYGISAIYAATQAYDPGFLPLVTQVVPADDVAIGYVVTLIGALSLHLSYSAVRSLRSHAGESRQNTSERSDFRLWVFVFGLGLAALLRPALFSSIGAARAILQLAPFGILLTFCSLPRQYFGLNIFIYRTIFILGNVLLVFCAFIYGSKFTSMMSLLPVFSAILARPKLKKALPLLIIGGACVYLFIVAPIITTARMSGNDESQSQKIRSAAGEALSVFDEDLRFAISDQVERFLYRQFESTAAGFIVGDVRDHGFRNGDTMQNLTYAFIPRVLWPEKPMVTRGNWFTAYLGGAASEEEAETSTGMYSSGELYWNFGFPGVILGMALMGSLFALLYSIIGDGPHCLVIPMVIFINLILRIVEQAAAGEVTVILIYILVFAFIYRYFTPPTSGVQGDGFATKASGNRVRQSAR